MGNGELAEYSLDDLRHADDTIGNREIVASWRRRLQRHIKWREQRKGWVTWCREHLVHLVWTALGIILASVALAMIGL